ncbi:MAG TPA: DUF4397 domain-containing protein [Gemmatimonadaceae bacterium]|jgi:hypothetical protein|nr:DUF4397 domain-containing protein [Gemmatimonadaceae bacterium]
MKTYRLIFALFSAAALSSCGQEGVQDITAPAAGAGIKFFNFGVNAPGVNFWGNSTKLTAISSSSGSESTTGTNYGGAGNGGLYSVVAPGPYTFSGKIAATTDNGLAVSTITATLENGKYYSFYQSGFYNSTAKTVDAFIVEDAFPTTIDYSAAYVRFVNAISNANPMTLYAKNSTTAVEGPVGGEIAYKGAGAFVAMPEGFYDLSTRYTGSSTNVLTRPGVSFVAGRVYTITARGDITVAPSTACGSANKTCLDNTTNR